MKKFFALVAVAVLVAFAAPALAANPFMDVPMNHWAYDAIGQLASHGIITGYPDGTYKGNQPMTRYELATLVARALAVVDMDKASKQDVEMLKKLVVEFKDELDALGVKVDEIDSRVAVLEENIGGWKFWGQFRFDAKMADTTNEWYGDNYALDGDTEFDLNRYRIFMSKQIDETTKFTARIGNNNGDLKWERYWIDIKLGYDIDLAVGRWNVDWEDERGLYADDDAWFTDRTMTGFWFKKDFGMFNAEAIVAHVDDDDDPIGEDYMAYGLTANVQFNEYFRFALNAFMNQYDNADNRDESVYWADFGFNFNPNIAFKGAYFMQDLDTPYVGTEDDPSAFKFIVDVKQDAFGFTSLWLEYAELDRGFNLWNDWAYDAYGASLLWNRNWDETTILFAYLTQKWNDKWTTFQRYAQAEFDTTGVDDTTNWTFGLRYQHTPAVMFELAYDDYDYGQGGDRAGDDHLIRLRTFVNF